MEHRGEMDIGFEPEFHPSNNFEKTGTISVTRSGKLVKKPKHHYHFVNFCTLVLSCHDVIIICMVLKLSLGMAVGAFGGVDYKQL